jgi:hypothetical protein
VRADFGGFFGEAFFAFLDEVEVAAAPEAPRIAGSHFPAEGDAPEHGHDLDAQLDREVEQFEDVILGPLFDLVGGFGGDIRGNERADRGTAGPGGRVHPEGAMRRDPVEAQSRFREGVFDFFGALESAIGLEHVVGRLRASGARFLRPFQEGIERFGPMLGAFDTGMETILAHKLLSVVDCCGRSLSIAPT